MKNNIRIERARAEISQSELAEAVGVSRQTIHSIEKRKYVPSAVLAMKIASYFGLSVEDIFELED